MLLKNKEHLSFNEFKILCDEVKEMQYHKDYFDQHANRFYRTFLLCQDLLSGSTSKKVLSLGAGSAYIEVQLAKLLDAEIHVLDYPDSIKKNKRYYKNYNFKYYPLKLSGRSRNTLQEKFDLILCCEVLEHLPAPPQKIIKDYYANLVSGGYFIISTPNLARLNIIFNLIRSLPILPPPALSFSEIGLDNLGIHRREYVESEIISALTVNALRPVSTIFTWNSRRLSTLKKKVFWGLEIFSPRLRPTMIIGAQK